MITYAKYFLEQLKQLGEKFGIEVYYEEGEKLRILSPPAFFFLVSSGQDIHKIST